MCDTWNALASAGRAGDGPERLSPPNRSGLPLVSGPDSVDAKQVCERVADLWRRILYCRLERGLLGRYGVVQFLLGRSDVGIGLGNIGAGLGNIGAGLRNIGLSLINVCVGLRDIGISLIDCGLVNSGREVVFGFREVGFGVGEIDLRLSEVGLCIREIRLCIGEVGLGVREIGLGHICPLSSRTVGHGCSDG